jgi:hypothetical protein
MRSCVRFSFLALLVGVLVAVAAPGAQAAVGIEKFVATNCKAAFPECAEEAGPTTVFGPTKIPKEPSKAEAEVQGFTQAGGRVPFGVTDFKLTTIVTGAPLPTTEAPTGIVKHIRTDVAPGLATSPAAVPQCSGAQFGETEAVPGSGFFPPPTCPAAGPTSTLVGTQEATVYAGAEAGDVPLSGNVYNLVQKPGLASEFGVALSIPQPLSAGALKAGFKEAEEKGAVPGVGGFPTLAQQAGLEAAEYFAHTLIEGSVEWGQESKGTNQGDYHDYFEIDVSPKLPLIRSRLSFFGTTGNGAFITNATSCPGHNTTRLATTGTEGMTVTRNFTTPIGLSGCGAVPFDPALALTPGTSAFDQPDEITTQVAVPRVPSAAIDNAQLKTASVTLPEGMTLNPSAAAGLAACSPAQARIHSAEKGVGCPAASEIGTVELVVPTLPEKEEGTGQVPLKGKIYLGGPESGPITGPPYIIYLDAESARYGVSVRIKGETIPNPATGRVTTVFSENPEQPFTNAALHFGRGALTPIANPLSCGAAATTGTFVPYTTPEGATKAAVSAFTPTGCPNPLPFALTQSTVNQTTTAGGHTNYTFNLGRADGQQYLSQVKTTLPPGLVGAIPTVTQCTDAQAASNTCPATSQIGTASATSGSGPTPFTFGNGVVYLTGPYQGAPFGLSIVVPAIAGPFNLGPAITRARINVDPTTARVITTANVPTIVGGIPTRIRGISVSINKQGFLYNPTNCSPLATDSTLLGFVPGVAGFATQNISSPFQVGNCSALKFKPGFKASSNAKTSKANGASLTTTVTPGAGQANIKSVKVSLPKALPSRLTTLQKACTEAQFAANPLKCPSGSFVGGATVVTPTLPGKMTGPAILVSHGGAAFPDLDLVVKSNGVTVILVGNTDIKKGITTTTFASTPDVPVSSVTVNLPIGSHSALAANGNLCARPLIMPTTITGQNGTVVKQNTKIAVSNCGVRIVGHKVVGNTAYLTVQTFGAGRVSGKGSGLATSFRRFSKAQKKATLKVPLSRGGRSRHRPFKVRLRVGFVPKAKGGKSSASFVSVSFR